MKMGHERLLEQHDVSDLIGLRVVVANAVREITEEDGDVSVEIPNIDELSAVAGLTRCLMPLRLRGKELRAIRRIAGWSAAELAERMGEKTSPETISRWENDRQPMGGYAEKVFRLVICDELRGRAPGVDYRDGAIAKLVVLDPWREDAAYVVPAIVVDRVRVKRDGQETVSAWEAGLRAAA